jgi:hypothetical protein
MSLRHVAVEVVARVEDPTAYSADRLLHGLIHHPPLSTNRYRPAYPQDRVSRRVGKRGGCHSRSSLDATGSATLGLILGGAIVSAGVAAAAALWGLVDADGFAARFADVEAFDEGTLSARAAIGLFIGLGGGVLAVLGALLSYRFTLPVAE